MNNLEKKEHIDKIKEKWFNVILVLAITSIVIGTSAGLFFLIMWIDSLENSALVFFVLLVITLISPLLIYIAHFFYETIKAIKYSIELKKNFTKKGRNVNG